ncbi:PREDICTED: uncharacterized protein LOC106820712 [Priapulus caudatus]|uniref:Uncharacterized protein LOC106820712 n=1 Tax=Priapulus caudatus TaxID=37621 RepID=A0ABM1F8D5_PRICU|nr:PREDICTED: uncharacterized protein LOC106820712 [Priapulus caudatus]
MDGYREVQGCSATSESMSAVSFQFRVTQCGTRSTRSQSVPLGNLNRAVYQNTMVVQPARGYGPSSQTRREYTIACTMKSDRSSTSGSRTSNRYFVDDYKSRDPYENLEMRWQRNSDSASRGATSSGNSARPHPQSSYGRSKQPRGDFGSSWQQAPAPGIGYPATDELPASKRGTEPPVDGDRNGVGIVRIVKKNRRNRSRPEFSGILPAALTADNLPVACEWTAVVFARRHPNTRSPRAPSISRGCASAGPSWVAPPHRCRPTRHRLFLIAAAPAATPPPDWATDEQRYVPASALEPTRGEANPYFTAPAPKRAADEANPYFTAPAPKRAADEANPYFTGTRPKAARDEDSYFPTAPPDRAIEAEDSHFPASMRTAARTENRHVTYPPHVLLERVQTDGAATTREAEETVSPAFPRIIAPYGTQDSLEPFLGRGDAFSREPPLDTTTSVYQYLSTAALPALRPPTPSTSVYRPSTPGLPHAQLTPMSPLLTPTTEAPSHGAILLKSTQPPHGNVDDGVTDAATTSRTLRLVTVPPPRTAFDFYAGIGDGGDDDVDSIKAEAPLDITPPGGLVTPAVNDSSPAVVSSDVELFRPYKEYNFGINGFVFPSPTIMDTISDLLRDFDEINDTAKSRPAKSFDEASPTDHVGSAPVGGADVEGAANVSAPQFAGLSQTNVVEQFTLYKGVTVILRGEEEYYEELPNRDEQLCMSKQIFQYGILGISLAVVIVFICCCCMVRKVTLSASKMQSAEPPSSRRRRVMFPQYNLGSIYSEMTRWGRASAHPRARR